MEVQWAGWSTTTYRLQQAGWDISAEQDIREASLRIAFRHAPQKLYAMTSKIDFDYYSRFDSPETSKYTAPLQIQFMASDVRVIIQEPTMAGFMPIDAAPQIAMLNAPKKMEDFNIFAVPMARTQEIIVEPQDVDFFLAKILEMQRPLQKEIRSRLPRNGEIRPEQKFHAQILSLVR